MPVELPRLVVPVVAGEQQGAEGVGFALIVGDTVAEAVAVGAMLSEAAAEGERDAWADCDAVGVGGAVGATGAMARTTLFALSAT